MRYTYHRVQSRMEELLGRVGRLVTQIDNMSAKLDEVSSRLYDHIGQCDHGRCTKVQQEATDDSGMKDQTMWRQHQSNSRKGRYRCSKEENLEESLRKSVQENIVILVENVSFAASSLPDMLISKNCLSENETQEICKLPNEKDQIRNVIRLLKGRSYEVMKTFLECLKQECPHVADKISATYKKKLCEYDTKPVCGYCKLKCSVDLKYLADNVWSIGALDDLVYSEIVMGNRCQNELWVLFSEECNTSKRISEVIDKLVSALKERNFYKYLAPKVATLSELKCTCKIDLTSSMKGAVCSNKDMTMDSDQSSTDTTASPESSVYTGNGDTSSNVSDLESEEEPIAQSQLGLLESLPSLLLGLTRSPRSSNVPVKVLYQRFCVRGTQYDDDYRNRGGAPYDLDPVIRRSGRRVRPASSFY